MIINQNHPSKFLDAVPRDTAFGDWNWMEKHTSQERFLINLFDNWLNKVITRKIETDTRILIDESIDTEIFCMSLILQSSNILECFEIETDFSFTENEEESITELWIIKNNVSTVCMKIELINFDTTTTITKEAVPSQTQAV